MSEDIYDFGHCKMCSKYTQLKNGLCITCNDKDMPEFFKDLFKDKEN